MFPQSSTSHLYVVRLQSAYQTLFNTVDGLMEDILHQLIWRISHYLKHGFSTDPFGGCDQRDFLTANSCRFNFPKATFKRPSAQLSLNSF